MPLVASKEGYVIGSSRLADGPVRIELQRIPQADYPDYCWVDPAPNATETHNCGNCHQEIYDEWQRGGHAHSATNRRFLELYGGSDREKPGSDQWNLLAELPHGAAVCASCHAPSVEFDDPATDDMRRIAGVAAHGVHCDFCHKVQDVSIEQVGLTHGRFGMRLLRPRQGQLFFGPLEDVDRGEDTFSAVQRESRYCASCHEGTLFGVHVYKTWSEWLESPARQQGLQCQSCHMAPDGALSNIAPGMGGIERDPQTLASHDLLPGGQQAMLRRALEVDISTHREAQGWQCEVSIVARHVGHRVPTGFVDRHLILIVEAKDESGQALPARSGGVLPAAAGDLTARTGHLFGRLLHDDAGHSPVPFWRASGELSDTRLRPDQRESFAFGFPRSAARLSVRLIYRRFWQQVAQAKGWPSDDIVVWERDLGLDEALSQ
jgi:hypothetical protein